MASDSNLASSSSSLCNLTIGVMARAPIPGHCKTRLAASVGDALAADLCRAMLLDTIDNIDAALQVKGGGAGSRRVVMAAPEHDGEAVLRQLVPETWDVVPQQGDDLGARLANAFVTLVGGVERGRVVALVDADSPTAPWGTAILTMAATTTTEPKREKRAFMGPCQDGGYWLIAITHLAALGILEGISWSTSAVAEQTRTRCRELGITLEELAIGFDVDGLDDIARMREELGREPGRAPQTAGVLRLSAGRGKTSSASSP